MRGYEDVTVRLPYYLASLPFAWILSSNANILLMYCTSYLFAPGLKGAALFETRYLVGGAHRSSYRCSAS